LLQAVINESRPSSLFEDRCGDAVVQKHLQQL